MGSLDLGLDQSPPLAVAAPLGRHGDAQHAPQPAGQRLALAGMGRQRLGQQMASRTTLAPRHLLGEAGLETSLVAAHHHSAERRPGFENTEDDPGTIQQPTQIGGGSAIVGLHQQAEQRAQSGLVVGQNIAVQSPPGRLFQPIRAGRGLGIQQQQTCGQCFQRITLGPADRLGQVAGPPVGRLAGEPLAKAQREAAPGALVAVDRGSKGDTRKGVEPLPQQRCGNRRGLVDQQ